MALLLALAVAIVTAVQVPRPQPRDPVKKAASTALTGSIIGRVTDAETGRPVSDALIRAAVPSNESRQRFETFADADGRFEITRLPPGEYVVAAIPHQHRATHRSAGFGFDDVSAASAPSAPRVTVAAGEARGAIDIKLPRARAIEGRISNSAGEPLGDVLVRAERRDGRREVREARTDDHGLFRVYGLAPGAYRLCAETRSAATDLGAPSAPAAPYLPSCYSAGPAAARPDAIVVGSADVTGADISMGRGEGLTPARAGSGGATLRGRVTEMPSGMPLSGAVVLVRSFGGDGSFTTAITDSEGWYEVTGLSAGVWTVRAAPGHHRASHVPRGYSTSGTMRGVSGVRISEREERSDLNITLPRAASIAGRIVDESGEPVSGIRLQLYHAPGGRPVLSAAQHRSDDRGEFRLFGIEPGQYFLCAQPPIIIRSRTADAGLRRRTPVASCQPSDVWGGFGQAITVVSGEIGGLEIRMPWHRTRNVTGTVLGSDGGPARGAIVSARPLTGRGRFGVEEPPTGADGSFTFSEVPPGRYTLSARSSSSDPESDAEWAAVEVDLTTEDAKGVILTLLPPVTTRGRITYDGQEPSGSPLPVVIVESAAPGLFPLHSSKPEVTEDLRFEIHGRLGPQLIAIERLPSGWVVEGIRYRGADIAGVPTTFVSAAEEVEVVLTNKPARVSGRVLDAQGRPVSSAVVLMLPADRARLLTRRTWTMAMANRDGQFETPAVPAGDYRLLALTEADLDDVAADNAAELFDRYADRVRLVENELRTMDVRLRPLHDLR